MIASTHTSNDLNSRTMGRKLVVSGSLRRPASQAPTEGSCLLREIIQNSRDWRTDAFRLSKTRQDPNRRQWRAPIMAGDTRNFTYMRHSTTCNCKDADDPKHVAL